MCCHLYWNRFLVWESFLRWYCRYLSFSSARHPSIDLAFSPNFRRPRDSALLLWVCAGQWTYSRRRHSTWVPPPALGCSSCHSKIIPPSSIIAAFASSNQFEVILLPSLTVVASKGGAGKWTYCYSWIQSESEVLNFDLLICLIGWFISGQSNWLKS